MLLSAADLQQQQGQRQGQGQGGGRWSHHARSGAALSGPGPWVIEDWFCPPLVRLLRLAGCGGVPTAAGGAEGAARCEGAADADAGAPWGARPRSDAAHGAAARGLITGPEAARPGEATEATLRACQR